MSIGKDSTIEISSSAFVIVIFTFIIYWQNAETHLPIWGAAGKPISIKAVVRWFVFILLKVLLEQ